MSINMESNFNRIIKMYIFLFLCWVYNFTNLITIYILNNSHDIFISPYNMLIA